MKEMPPEPKPFLSYEEYNRQGDLYVAAQRKFYSDAPDTGRKFFRAAMEQDIQNKVIADIGCGAGDDLVTYQEMGAKKVIGIEPSSLMLEVAKKTLTEKGKVLELLQGDWEHIPLPDQSVDVVTSRFSLHVIPTYQNAMKEVARVLKSDGHFLIIVPHPKYDAKLAQEQNVGQKQTIKSTLFGGTVTVENYQHAMADYTSEDILQNFTVEKIVEYSMLEKSDESEPTALVIDYRRR